MSSLGLDIKKAKDQAEIYVLMKIDAYANTDGLLYVLDHHSKQDDRRFYINSEHQFGDWLKRSQFKIGDKFKITVHQSGEVIYAEAMETSEY